ncbi:MAG: NAD(P)/FAD-dependent oxidoreductase, partial [Clostridia bacterium]|nr:NAD(P)/FAD-dependent oxidoreductase [Clostridia bacterium]
MNIAIIGGGASALFCALNINKNYNVTIFCNEEKLGKKILVTGNGRCNLSNISIYDDSYNVNLDYYFSRFSPAETLDYFNSLGLEVYQDDEGRVYPISNTATSVVDILTREIEKCNNIQIKLNTKVEFVQKQASQYVVNNEYIFDKVVVCTGSVTDILNCLNIKFNSFVPSLMAVKTQQNTKRLSGQKLSNVKVTLKYSGGTKV